ncbi:unnamed protein product [Camellia sinensis]
MQRWCTKLRSLAILHSTHKPTQLSVSSSSPPSPFSHRLLHSSPQFLHTPLSLSLISSNYENFIQVRRLTKKEMKEKMKKFKPRTPVKSKLKKIKMKCYSSFKGRFRLMHDGNIRRWKEGKRHNAHLKKKHVGETEWKVELWTERNLNSCDKELLRFQTEQRDSAKRRLRQPGIVPLAYAKVMKKLNFCG